MDWIASPQAWIGLVMLVSLEVVLGIDNIIFISVMADKLPAEQRRSARRLGLLAAMGGRILLLMTLSLVVGLTATLAKVGPVDVSGRDAILVLGGLFLIAKSVSEIHEKIEGQDGSFVPRRAPSFAMAIAQIMLMDIIFSLDSVITAVGMVNHLPVMVAAVVIAVVVMFVFVDPVSAFVDAHPTIKMLALAFLLLIGTNLFLDGFGVEVPKGYIYFAMAFSVFVEMLNLRVRGRSSDRSRLAAESEGK